MKAQSFLLLAVPALLLFGCGGDDSGSTQTSNVSFSVSDAPVDEASSVTIGFTQIELVKDDGSSIFLDVEPSNPSDDYQQIDLLDYQGQLSAPLVSDQAVPVGTYKNLILHISSESDVNFVVDSLGTQQLKQPSNKLKLGSFEVTGEPEQQFTIEFDLRKSLVERGNDSTKNGYILKPHGVSILSTDLSASLTVSVDTYLFSTDENCPSTAESAFVYLYEGSVVDGNLIDLVDDTDTAFDDTNPVPEDAVVPFASTSVNNDGTYTFGYLPSGEYTVAFTCDGTDDNSIDYDGLTIPQPAGLVSTVTLVAGEDKTMSLSGE